MVDKISALEIYKEVNRGRKRYQYIMIPIMFFFLIILSFEVQAFTYTLYDDASSDKLATLWETDGYTTWLHDNTNKNYYTSSASNTYIMDRPVNTSVSPIGVRANISVTKGSNTGGAAICIGNGTTVRTHNANNQNNYARGYCLYMPNTVYLQAFNNSGEGVTIASNSTGLAGSGYHIWEIRKVQNQNYVEVLRDGNVYFNVSDESYNMNETSSYMFFGRYYSGSYYNYVYVRDIYTITGDAAPSYTIKGIVKNGGVATPNVFVDVVNVATNASFSLQTNSSGRFLKDDISIPGLYKVTAWLFGNYTLQPVSHYINVSVANE